MTFSHRKEAAMFKLGWAMIISSVLIVVGWTLYKLWLEGQTDSILAIICICLWVGGVVIIMTSKIRL